MKAQAEKFSLTGTPSVVVRGPDGDERIEDPSSIEALRAASRKVS
ncbi:MAG: hypothetical protein ACR2NA_09025 [Solirubrobacterales bacterium]